MPDARPPLDVITFYPRATSETAPFWASVVAFIPFNEGVGSPRIWRRRLSTEVFEPSELTVVGSPQWENHPEWGMGMRFDNANPDYLVWDYIDQPDPVPGKESTPFTVLFVGAFESGPSEHVLLSRPETGLELLVVPGVVGAVLPPDTFLAPTSVDLDRRLAISSSWDHEKVILTYEGEVDALHPLPVSGYPLLPRDYDVGIGGPQLFFSRASALSSESFKGFAQGIYILSASLGQAGGMGYLNEFGIQVPDSIYWSIAQEPFFVFGPESLVLPPPPGSGGGPGGGADGEASGEGGAAAPRPPLVQELLAEFQLRSPHSERDVALAFYETQAKINELVRVLNRLIEHAS